MPLRKRGILNNSLLLSFVLKFLKVYFETSHTFVQNIQF
jgi:hypothetical protein